VCVGKGTIPRFAADGAAAMSAIPNGPANCQNGGMQKYLPRTYILRATNPKLEPPNSVQVFLMAEAADAQANELFAAGYDVTVTYSLVHKEDDASRI
jgi:hypothetical protein